MLLLCAILTASAAPWPTGANDPAPWTTTPSGLEVQDLVVGTGEEVVEGAVATVHYTGMLADGTLFDSSHDRGETFTFKVGAHEVIRGWEEGTTGMRIGGTRRLVIPPELGYGARAAGPIPPNSVLYFEIELHDVEAPRAAPAAPEPVADDAWILTKTGIRWADVQVGDGGRARMEHRVCVDTATWRDGKLVEHTYLRTRCTWLRLGEGDLPAPVEQVMVKMRAGGVRLVVVPPQPGEDATASPATWRIALSNVGD